MTQDTDFSNFEKNLETLNALAAELDRPDLPLEQAIATYEKGVSLIKTCQATLQQAELTIETLSSSDD